MLFELHIKYKNGQTDRPIVFTGEGEPFKFIPTSDIIAVGSRRFRYKVKKHDFLPIAIVRMGGKTLIYPSNIECHPQTTLEDIMEIKSKKSPTKNPTIPKTPNQTWSFDSTSGGGKYIVTKTLKGLKCDCPGSWRAKDRRCKHIKEVEKY